MPRILDVKPGSLSGSDEAGGGPQRPPAERERWVYTIQADSLNQGRLQILATPGLPTLGSVVIGVYGNLYLSRRNAQEIDAHARLWEAEFEYDVRADPQQPDQDPANLLAVYDWESETATLVVDTDQVTGDPIVNAVGERFFPEIDMPIPVLVYERFELNFSPTTILNYVGHTNELEFWGAPPDCALMKPITTRDHPIKGQRWKKVTYRIAFNPLKNDAGENVGWTYNPLHQGTKFLPAAGAAIGDAKPFQEAHGGHTTGNLNEDGTANEFGETYLHFNTRPQADYDALNLVP
jgi:hypothetical protein